MKKAISIILVLSLTMCLFGCGTASSQTPDVAPTPTEAAGTPAVTAAPEDSSTPESDVLPISELGQRTSPYAKYDIKPNEKYRIVYANLNASNNFAMYIQQSIVDAAAYYGVELTVMENALDPVTAVSNANNAVIMNADFYIQYMQPAEVNASVADVLMKADIPFCTLQTQMPMGVGATEEAPFYGISNFDCAAMASKAGVEKAIELWGEDCELILFTTGKVGMPMHQARIEGAISGAQEAMPDIVYETVLTQNNQATEYSQLVTDFLTSHPNSKVLFFSPNDMTGLAMVQAIRLAGRESDCLYVSAQYDYSMSEELLAEDSVVCACTDVFPEAWGWTLIPRIIQYLNDGVELPAKEDSFNILLTKDNYEEFYG